MRAILARRWQSFKSGRHLVRLAILSQVLLTVGIVDAAECLPNDPISCRPPPSRRLPMVIESPIPEKYRKLYFASGSVALSAAAEEIISLQAAILRADTSDPVTIVGSSESKEIGSRQAALSLSTTRCLVVRDRLVELGVAAERLSIQAYDADAVFVLSDTEETRKTLRRVELYIAPRSIP